MMKIHIQNEKKKKRNRGTYKLLRILLIPIVAIIAGIPSVMAHCPLCTAATVAGVGVTRSLGWDDSIVGVFVGAMIVSSALLVNNILKKKNIGGGNAILRIISIVLLTIALTFLSFYYAGIFGPANIYRIFGMEKITFGAISGGVVSLATFWISNEIKRKNNGDVLFNYQTMAITFSA